MTKYLDWSAKQAKARKMSDDQLVGAIADIIATLVAADALDRSEGSCDGGYYRDECSVYRAEQARRLKHTKRACKHCGCIERIAGVEDGVEFNRCAGCDHDPANDDDYGDN